MTNEPKGNYIHKQIKHKNQFENLKNANKRILKLVENWRLELQEADLIEYAEGWLQQGKDGSPDGLVLVFNQDFKAYCQHLEKIRLLPFNFF